MNMEFTVPCFIRNNTPELRSKLEELGYYKLDMQHGTWESRVEDNPCIRTDYEDCLGGYFVGESDYFEPHCVDCGTNEDLFLALVALRNDTYKGQWFVIDVDVCSSIPKGTWVKVSDMNDDRRINPLYCHKATKKEIIEHFKTKNDDNIN